MKFQELELSKNILRAVEAEGYETPSEIQAAAIPSLLEGKDLIGCAQTGTGKTAAFALPILHLLEARGITPQRKIRSLILTPTRELAVQIFESFHAYGRYTKLKYGVIFGGVSQRPQETMLQKGIDVLVATPGRLNDLIGQGFIHLDGVEIFVLDEADRMLDMGFINDVKKVIKQLPEQKQTLLFSATMPTEIRNIADRLMKSPVQIAVKPVSSTVDAVSQAVYFVDKNNKQQLLTDIILKRRPASALVFTRTKHGADKVVKGLLASGVKAAAIHGNKSQNNRQMALNSFKSGSLQVLVATDIAARGIDVDKLALVVNFDLPNIPETYVHRIGRTGRAGETGDSISFCDYSEKPYLSDIEKLIKKAVPVIEDHPYPMQVFETPPKEPRQPRPARQQRGAPGQNQSRRNPEKKSAEKKPTEGKAAERKPQEAAPQKRREQQKPPKRQKQNAQDRRAQNQNAPKPAMPPRAEAPRREPKDNPLSGLRTLGQGTQKSQDQFLRGGHFEEPRTKEFTYNPRKDPYRKKRQG